MLSAMRLLSLNPWVIVGVLVCLGGAIGGSFLYGVRTGGTAAELRCEKRVAKIMQDLKAKQDEVDKLNKDWQARIDALDNAYTSLLEEENKSDAELEKRIADYEQTLASGQCAITGDDLDRVRGKP